MAAESTNNVNLIGKLAAIEHREGKDDNNIPYIAGKAMIKTGEDNIIPVDFFQKAKTNAGNDNSVYAGIVTMVEEFKTIAKDGEEEADTVQIGGSNLSENSYTDIKTGIFHRGFQTRAAFYSRKNGGDTENKFTLSGIVMGVIEEVVNEVPTGNLLIDLLVIGYNNRGDVIRLNVEDPKGAAYIKNSISKGDEVKFQGEIINAETKTEKVEQVAFGDPIVQVITKIERKLIITSATAAKASAVEDSEVQTILAEREGRLEKAKEKAANKNAKSAAPERKGFSL